MFPTYCVQRAYSLLEVIFSALFADIDKHTPYILALPPSHTQIHYLTPFHLHTAASTHICSEPKRTFSHIFTPFYSIQTLLIEFECYRMEGLGGGGSWEKPSGSMV